MCEKFSVNEIFAGVDDQVHDCFRHQISRRFCNNPHVRVDQISDRFYLAFQLKHFIWEREKLVQFFIGFAVLFL